MRLTFGGNDRCFGEQQVKFPALANAFFYVQSSKRRALLILFSNLFTAAADPTLQRPPSLHNTPLNSPFIPDISFSSPVLTKALNAGTRSQHITMSRSQHIAMSPIHAISPIQRQTISLNSAGIGTEPRHGTPMSRSRHSFPPAANPNSLSTTPTSNAFSPQGGHYNGRGPTRNQRATAGRSREKPVS